MPASPQHLRLELCSGDNPAGIPCPNPANWMLIPVEVDDPAMRSPFCNDCAQDFFDGFMQSNPEGFQMTVQQAHLWIAQGRLCICPHPGENCPTISSVVIKSGEEVFAICVDCLSCGNGIIEGLQEVLSAFTIPTTKQ